MMNELDIEKIDVCQKYFHIDDMPIRKYSVVLKTDHVIVMNHIISKKDAIEFVRRQKCENQNKLSSLSISLFPLCMDSIKDFMDKKVFADAAVRYCGWLFQYDPTPFANWYHDCFYYFIVNNTTFLKIKHNRGLSEAIKMQIL